MERQILLQMKGIYKRFGGLDALRNVDFKVYQNEIVGLVGDNGAGKSTLIKIIAGVYTADEGEIWFEGKRTTPQKPSDAKNLGIETVYQDLALCDDLDVSSNLFLGREINKRVIGNLIKRLDKSKMHKRTAEVLDGLGIQLDSVKKETRFLSGGQRQGIALAKTAYWGTKLALMDEPTAALGVRESKEALKLVQTLNEKRNLSVIFISHNLEHVFAVAHRIVVLRLGQMVGEKMTEKTTSDEIVGMITGAKFANLKEED